MELSEFESIFKDIWEHDGKNKEKAKPYNNSFQKWAFWLMVGLFALALLVAVSTWVKILKWQKPVALILVALSQLSAFTYQLSSIFEGFKVLKEPTRHFFEPVIKSAANDYQLANSLIKFDGQQLNYVHSRLVLESEQMKGRINIFVGAIDKVGIFPMMITWFFSTYKYLADGKLKFSQIDWIVYGLLAMYLAAISMLFFVRKLERYTLIVSSALHLKEANKVLQPTAKAAAEF